MDFFILITHAWVGKPQFIVDVGKEVQAVIITMALLMQTMPQCICKPAFARPCILITNWNNEGKPRPSHLLIIRKGPSPHTLTADSLLRQGPAGVRCETGCKDGCLGS